MMKKTNRLASLEAERVSVELEIVDLVKRISRGGMNKFNEEIKNLNNKKDKLEELDHEIDKFSE